MLIRKTSLLIFLALLNVVLLAQEKGIYKDLKDYGRFGFLVGPALYQKGEVDHQFGKYSIDPKMVTSFNVGFDYDFYPQRLWSFQVGLFVGYEPADIVDVIVPANEVDGNSEEMYPFRSFGVYSLSIPMTIRIQKRLGKKLYGQLKGGLRLMNYQTGSVSSSISFYEDENFNEGKLVYYSEMHTPETRYYGSLLLGGGVSWVSKWFLMRANLMYVVNSQAISEGYYRFVNMESEDSGGSYKMSGNYFALWLSFHIKRNKNR